MYDENRQVSWQVSPRNDPVTFDGEPGSRSAFTGSGMLRRPHGFDRVGQSFRCVVCRGRRFVVLRPMAADDPPEEKGGPREWRRSLRDLAGSTNDDKCSDRRVRRPIGTATSTKKNPSNGRSLNSACRGSGGRAASRRIHWPAYRSPSTRVAIGSTVIRPSPALAAVRRRVRRCPTLES